MKTPILFLTYRRFHTAARVFQSIRNARPERLYFASNGPNPINPNEFDEVHCVRGLIEKIDWPCKVKTRLLSHHLNVKDSICSSIDWFFENEEYGIILEDDCLPHHDFYSFSERLLLKYQFNEQIYAISGTNFQNGQRRGPHSHYFSKYNHVWGWATWRRAWNKNDSELHFWPDYKKSSAWKAFWPNTLIRLYWTIIFDRVFDGKIVTWDYPWTASVWRNNGLTVIPNVNLVSNIGFGPDATHTKTIDSLTANMVVAPMGSTDDPTAISNDSEADNYTFRTHYLGMAPNFISLVYLPFRVVSWLFRNK